MSWSFHAQGTPKRIIEELERQSGFMAGHSKEEFDAAKVHIVSLLMQNFDANRSEDSPPWPLVELNASGNGTFDRAGNALDRCCTVSIKPSYGALLI